MGMNMVGALSAVQIPPRLYKNYAFAQGDKGQSTDFNFNKFLTGLPEGRF